MCKRDTESVKVAPESVLSNRGISNVRTWPGFRPGGGVSPYTSFLWSTDVRSHTSLNVVISRLNAFIRFYPVHKCAPILTRSRSYINRLLIFFTVLRVVGCGEVCWKEKSAWVGQGKKRTVFFYSIPLLAMASTGFSYSSLLCFRIWRRKSEKYIYIWG